MDTVAVWCFLLAVYVFLGVGVLDLIQEIERRQSEEPSNPWLIVIIWPSILGLIAWTRLDGQ